MRYIFIQLFTSQASLKPYLQNISLNSQKLSELLLIEYIPSNYSLVARFFQELKSTL